MHRVFFQSLFATLYIAFSGLLSPVLGADRWILLATQTLEGTQQTTSIDLVKLQGRYKALRLVMRRGNVVLNRVLVGYGNGQVHYEDRTINLKAGERTRPDSCDGATYSQQIRIPAGLAGGSGKDRARAGGTAVRGLGVTIRRALISYSSDRSGA